MTAKVLKLFCSQNAPSGYIRLHQGSGKPASVDYAINLQASNQLLKCIPVEAKCVFSITSIKQLSSYINKLSTCNELGNCAVVGLLMMQYQFRFVFSPYKFASNPEKTVPLVYISPSIEWRSESCINSKGLLLLSTIHLINFERILFSPPDSELLMEVAEKLYEVPHKAVGRLMKLNGYDGAYRTMLFL